MSPVLELPMKLEARWLDRGRRTLPAGLSLLAVMRRVVNAALRLRRVARCAGGAPSTQSCVAFAVVRRLCRSRRAASAGRRSSTRGAA